MAGAAREDAARLVVARRARRGPGSREGHARWTSARAFMASRAVIAVHRVEEGAVTDVSQGLHVPARTPRICETRGMNARGDARCAGPHPSHEEQPVGLADDVAMARPAERVLEQRSLGWDDGGPSRRRAPDRVAIGLHAKSGGRCRTCVATRTACTEHGSHLVRIGGDRLRGIGLFFAGNRGRRCGGERDGGDEEAVHGVGAVVAIRSPR